jgi:hypothetical protein
MTVESSSPKLRPLNLGELLDRIVRLYRQNFLTFIGIVAIVQVPVILIQLLFSLTSWGRAAQGGFDPTFSTGRSTEALGGSLVNILIAILSLILVQGIGTAAMTRAIANNYMGRKTGITEAYRQIGDVWLPLIGALLLSGLVVIALFVWWIVPCVGWITGLGILMFFSFVVVPLIAPIVVLERQSAASSIRRAWDLVRRRFWWVLGFGLILSLFIQLLVIGPSALLGLLQIGISDPFNPSSVSDSNYVISVVLQSLITMVTTLIFVPLRSTGYTLLYFDLRVRYEGFDLAMLAGEDAAGGDFDPDQVISRAPVAEKSQLVTWNEMGYFSLISIGVGILYFALVAIVAAIFIPLLGSGL